MACLNMLESWGKTWLSKQITCVGIFVFVVNEVVIDIIAAAVGINGNYRIIKSYWGVQAQTV